MNICGFCLLAYNDIEPTDAKPTERGVLASVGTDIRLSSALLFHKHNITNTTKRGTLTIYFMANIPRFGLTVN